AEKILADSEAPTEPLPDGAPATADTATTEAAPVAAAAAVADTPAGYAGTAKPDEDEIATNKAPAVTAESAAAAAAPASPIPDFASQQEASLGDLQTAVDSGLNRADQEQFARRVWEKDPTLWKPDPNEQQEITDRLGWLTVMTAMRAELPRLRELH